MILQPCVMELFPSRTYLPNYGFKDWVANHVTMEQAVGVCGFLFQNFVERQGLIVRDIQIAHKIDTSNCIFGSDKKTVERYINLENVTELFLLSADASSALEDLQVHLARSIGFAWELTAHRLFPGRHFESDVQRDLYDENGICVTISEV